MNIWAYAWPSEDPGGQGGNVGVAGVITHEVCYGGVLGSLKERLAVPHVPGTLGGGVQSQASVHSPRIRVPLVPRAPLGPHHLVPGLPLLHQVAPIQPDSVLCGVTRILRVWGPLGKHVLSASAQDHL